MAIRRKQLTSEKKLGKSREIMPPQRIKENITDFLQGLN